MKGQISLEFLIVLAAYLAFIAVVVNMQIGLITPPLGLDLYIMRNTFGIPAAELLRGVVPFLITLIIFLAVLVAFPEITLWLPRMMRG